MQPFEVLVENAREHGLTVSNLSEVRYGYWQAKMRHTSSDNYATFYEFGYGKTASEAIYNAIHIAIVARQGDKPLVEPKTVKKDQKVGSDWNRTIQNMFDPLADEIDPLADDDDFDPLAD